MVTTLGLVSFPMQARRLSETRGEIMGFWYFLLLFIGLFLVVKGLRRNKKLLLIFVGILFISFSIFMFSPGSDEIISELFNLN